MNHWGRWRGEFLAGWIGEYDGWCDVTNFFITLVAVPPCGYGAYGSMYRKGELECLN